jgi:hypothetical protein
MRVREAFAAGLLIAFGVAIGAALNRPSAAQVNQPPVGAIGRYQMMVSSGSHSYAIVTDTTNGRTWSHDAQGAYNWVDFGVPPIREAK